MLSKRVKEKGDSFFGAVCGFLPFHIAEFTSPEEEKKNVKQAGHDLKAQ